MLPPLLVQSGLRFPAPHVDSACYSQTGEGQIQKGRTTFWYCYCTSAVLLFSPAYRLPLTNVVVWFTFRLRIGYSNGMQPFTSPPQLHWNGSTILGIGMIGYFLSISATLPLIAISICCRSSRSLLR